MAHEHVFVDTNILVYGYDRSALAKRNKASALIRKLWDAPYPPAISTQVLHEFYINLLRKGVAQRDAGLLLESFFSWEVVPCDLDLTATALEIHRENKISLWDALIVSAAIRAKCSILYSEDLSHGQRFGSLEILNPFL